jgi:hypothetical protein
VWSFWGMYILEAVSCEDGQCWALLHLSWRSPCTRLCFSFAAWRSNGVCGRVHMMRMMFHHGCSLSQSDPIHEHPVLMRL